MNIVEMAIKIRNEKEAPSNLSQFNLPELPIADQFTRFMDRELRRYPYDVMEDYPDFEEVFEIDLDDLRYDPEFLNSFYNSWRED